MPMPYLRPEAKPDSGNLKPSPRKPVIAVWSEREKRKDQEGEREKPGASQSGPVAVAVFVGG